jgi:predicted secreted protein
MSKAQSTQGAKLYVESATAGTYVEIKEIRELGNVTDDTATDIDVTNLNSEEYKEYIRGLKEPPSADFTANYVADDAGQIRLHALYESGTNVKFKVVAAKPLTSDGDALTIIREGYIAKLSYDLSVDSVLSLVFTLRFSGKPTITQPD